MARRYQLRSLRQIGFTSLDNTTSTERSDVLPSNGARDDIAKSHSGRKRREPHTGIDSVLENLFTSTGRGKPVPPAKSPYSGTINVPEDSAPQATNTQTSFVGDLTQLIDQFYVQKAPPEEVWANCVELLGPKEEWKEKLSSDSTKATPAAFTDRNMIARTQVLQDLLLAICRMGSPDPQDHQVPTPAIVIQTYMNRGLMRYWWHQVLWAQLGAFHRLLAQDAGETAAPLTQSSSQRAIRIVQDLVNVWNLFFNVYGPAKGKSWGLASVRESSAEVNVFKFMEDFVRRKAEDGSYDKIAATSTSSRTRLSDEVSDRFLQLVPKHLKAYQIPATSAAAVMSLECILLLKERLGYLDLPSLSIQSYVCFVERLIRGTTINPQMAIDSLMGEGISSAASISTGLRNLHERANILLSPVRNQASSPHVHDEKDVPSETIIVPKRSQPPVRLDRLPSNPTLKQISEVLQIAVKQFDASLAIYSWTHFLRRSQQDPVEEIVLQQLYATFLTAFFGMGHPERAVDVWNHMVKAGSKPNERHWQAMIVGCTKSRDLLSMKDIWRKMKAAGIRPDIVSWTAWIHGLMRCKDWQLGIQALDELSSIWKLAPEVKEHSEPTKSIAPVNAAISGLIALGKTKEAQNVFNWAIAQNVKPEIATFNIMLRPAIRGDRSVDVQRILQQMQTHDCQPDVVTFAIIIDGRFRNPTSSFHTQTPEAQQRALMTILREMESQGIQPNAYIYGIILNGLEASKPFNVAAARTVLDHMATKEIRPSPHIYTTLMTHYFSADPADLPAIDSLWNRIIAENGIVDNIFYDRMIEGYARVGEAERMLFFLRLMPKKGKVPGWVALVEVLRALVRTEEWDMVRDLVVDVEKESGLFKHGQRGAQGKDEFWGLVQLVRERGWVPAGLEGDG